jgi:hypothetical protein
MFIIFDHAVQPLNQQMLNAFSLLNQSENGSSPYKSVISKRSELYGVGTLNLCLRSVAQREHPNWSFGRPFCIFKLLGRFGTFSLEWPG